MMIRRLDSWGSERYAWNDQARDIMSRVQQADFISWARFYTHVYEIFLV
jgi:hypothetical protein